MISAMFFVFVPLIVISYLYDSLSVAGIGLSVFLLVGCAGYALLVALNRHSSRVKSFFYERQCRNIFFVYLLFIFCCAIAHVATGSTTSMDYQYIASLAGQALWFPIMWYTVQRSPGTFEKVLKVSVIIICTVIGVFWIVGVLQNADVFFLRNNLSPFDNLVIAPHLFTNPNRAARGLMILLVLVLYFSYSSSRNESNRWRVLVFIISCLIFSTLSRAGIAGMLVLFSVVVIAHQQLGKKVVYLGSLSLVILCVILLTPGLSDRILQAMSTIGQIDGTLQTGALDYTKSIRARSWSASYQIITDNPVFGVGVSSALDEMGRYGGLAWKGGDELRAIWVHGGFLKIGLYTGFMGLVPFLVFVFLLGRAFFASYRKGEGEVHAIYAGLLGLAALIASIPVNIGADFYAIGFVWFMFAFLLARSMTTRK